MSAYYYPEKMVCGSGAVCLVRLSPITLLYRQTFSGKKNERKMVRCVLWEWKLEKDFLQRQTSFFVPCSLNHSGLLEWSENGKSGETRRDEEGEKWQKILKISVENDRSYSDDYMEKKEWVQIKNILLLLLLRHKFWRVFRRRRKQL